MRDSLITLIRWLLVVLLTLLAVVCIGVLNYVTICTVCDNNINYILMLSTIIVDLVVLLGVLEFSKQKGE